MNKAGLLLPFGKENQKTMMSISGLINEPYDIWTEEVGNEAVRASMIEECQRLNPHMKHADNEEFGAIFPLKTSSDRLRCQLLQAVDLMSRMSSKEAVPGEMIIHGLHERVAKLFYKL